MHADALPRQFPREGDWGRPVLLAALVHVLVLLVFTAAWLWSPQRNVEAAAGDPSLEASLDVSTADARVARQALRQTPEEFKPLPEPVPVQASAPEDTVPPPQPIPEPRPQDAPTPQQANAQERIAQPDNVDQERVSAMAISEEKARQEQEAKRRQEQIDLTERKRQEEAEQKLRLAKQQEEAEQKKRIADQQAQAEREQKLAEIRKQREQAEKDAKLAEQKLRQLAAARAQQASSAAAATNAPASPGQGGTSNDLAAKYAAAIQQAVLSQWVRPDSVPLGQKCTINIRQLPGGSVVDASVAPGCPFDEAGKRSIEAAVLRAQPLPYRGYESVFQRNLTFNFTAQDR
ncbi:MAG TPA: cell envelope integrity protein TolA [Xanthomonadaceae bacterium]|nr:cell envelope integrity protein TolA [Xanthomonadaceae bacterium]